METNSAKSEIAKQLDLSVIRYSRVWEDYRILVKGLEITSQDSVLVITSSGDNVLNLLLEEPREIIAIDMSPAQNSILELKLAAIQHLSYEEFLQLLGVAPSTTRLQLFERVQSHLSQYALEFWLANTSVIEASIIDSGRLDRYFFNYSQNFLPSVVSCEQVDAIFNAPNLEKQKYVFENLPLKEMERVTTSEVFSTERQKTEGRSSAQMKYTQKSSEEVSSELWQRLCRVASSLPASDNFYLSLFLRGNRGLDPVNNPQFSPPCLTRAGFDKLKGLVNRVSIVTDTVEDYLLKCTTKPNKAALSDIFEYMSIDATEKLFTVLAQTMPSGSRIAYWMLYNDRFPSQTSDLVYLSELSKTLMKEDRVFFYQQFAVMNVK